MIWLQVFTDVSPGSKHSVGLLLYVSDVIIRFRCDVSGEGQKKMVNSKTWQHRTAATTLTWMNGCMCGVEIIDGNKIYSIISSIMYLCMIGEALWIMYVKKMNDHYTLEQSWMGRGGGVYCLGLRDDHRRYQQWTSMISALKVYLL